jgi:hypothetical protein
MSLVDPVASCVRAAWLTLGARTIELDNPDGGWFCTSLDLGAPQVRENTYAVPMADGLIDLTQYLGGRVVVAEITTLVGAGAQIDAVAASFAPFMVPSARPVLHYILDRPGAAERTMTLRPSTTGYAWQIAGASERDIKLSWLAADPAAYDPTTQHAYAWSGAVASGGRTYNLTYPRTYPGGGGAVVNANVRSYGDLAVRPFLQIYGPITNPRVNLTSQVTGRAYNVNFLAGFRIDVGHRVDIDCAAHTAYVDGDLTQSALGNLDWSTLWASNGWPLLTVDPDWWVLHLAGDSTSNVSQCVASWRDAFLS